MHFLDFLTLACQPNFLLTAVAFHKPALRLLWSWSSLSTCSTGNLAFPLQMSQCAAYSSPEQTRTRRTLCVLTPSSPFQTQSKLWGELYVLWLCNEYSTIYFMSTGVHSEHPSEWTVKKMTRQLVGRLPLPLPILLLCSGRCWIIWYIHS